MKSCRLVREDTNERTDVPKKEAEEETEET